MEKLAVQLKQQLKIDQVALTVSEFHGLLSGILCAGNRDQSVWSLLTILINDGETFSQALRITIQHLKEQILSELNLDKLSITHFLDWQQQTVGLRTQSLVDWVNHFLLGMGVVQVQLDKFSGERQEAISDLKMIAGLRYYDDGALSEELQALQEVCEYVEILVCYLNSEFTVQD